MSLVIDTEGPDISLQTMQIVIKSGGKPYAAAGQTGCCLHTIAILQAYQAGPHIYLFLSATEAAKSVGRSVEGE